VALRGFEKRLESLVEGTFARVFRSSLRPVEIGRRMVREMDAERTVGVSGRTEAPNSFVVWMSPPDHEQFDEMHSALVRELCDAAREHAREEGYSFVGPLQVELVSSDKLRTGSFAIEANMVEAAGGAGAGSLLLPTGQRVPLGATPVTIGRLVDCNIQLHDPNVSRHHAEIQPSGDGYVLADLGSTNGSRVNGMRVGQHLLVEGDEILIGNTKMTFEAS
jgi:glycine/D-amino acid oxidase-like deaminating enzyme